jgi:small subunit ribosomal protein S2
MKSLLESGVHFGHRTNKWDPRMKPYIFTERNGIHIIDLQQTVKAINTAFNAVRDNVQKGGTVMFVGTKRQAQETVRDEAVRCGMPYVTERWLPGTLTNWQTIFARIQELERLEKMRDSGDIDRLTKKEGLMIEREINRLLVHLSGIRELTRPPEMLFIVDVVREATAVKEANITNVPALALVDTNCDPTGIDYVIPSNDDAIRAIKLLVGKIADAVLEGKAMRKDDDMAMEALQPTQRVMARGEAARSRALDVEEMDEENLLGESTLAKIVVHESDDDQDAEEAVAEETVTSEVEESKDTEPEKEQAPQSEVEAVAPETVPAEKPETEPAAEVEPEALPAVEAQPVESKAEETPASEEKAEKKPAKAKAEVTPASDEKLEEKKPARSKSKDAAADEENTQE